MNPLWKKIKDWYYVKSGRARIDAAIQSFRQQMEADRIRRGIPSDLEAYRQKFRRNLLGYWSTNPGYGPFAVTKWQFFPDGTALELYLSGSGNDKTHYLWRELDDFTIELLETGTETDRIDEDEPMEDDDEEDEAPKWFRRSYDFKNGRRKHSAICNAGIRRLQIRCM